MVKNITILKVLEPFLSKPKEKLHLAQISREINMPHPTARQWLNIIEKKGILKKSVQGRLTLYSLNDKNPTIIDYLTLAEKNKLIEICNNDLILKEIIHYLHRNLDEKTKAIIFGSAAAGFNEANDFDLLIIGRIDEKELNGLSKKINRSIHFITVSNFEKITQSLKREIIKKHLIIKGSEDIIRWMIW